MRCQFAAKPGKIESSIDLPHQMIFGNRLAKMKLVEQLTLVTLQTAHHGSTSPRFASTQRNHGSRPVSTDFCNKICQLQTSADFTICQRRQQRRPLLGSQRIPANEAISPVIREMAASDAEDRSETT